MEWVFHTGFEGGEQLGFSDTSDNVTEAISTVDPNSGARCLSLGFTQFNNRWTPPQSPWFARDGTSDPVLHAVTFGFAIKVSDLASWSVLDAIVVVEQTSTDTEIALRIKNDGSLEVFTSQGTVVSTAPGVVTAGEWWDIEMRTYPEQSQGVVQVGVNGAEVASVSGVDTFAGGGSLSGPVATKFNFTYGGSGTPTVELDDIRWGHGFTGLQGAKVHELLTPNSTTENDGTITGAATAHEATDEVPGSDTDYVDLDTVGDRLLMGLTDRTVTGDVDSIQVLATASAPSGAPGVFPIYEEGGTETDGPQMVLGSATETRYVTGPIETNPRTGLAWTTADINALQVGARRAS